jgi:hypothetical protein
MAMQMAPALFRYSEVLHPQKKLDRIGELSNLLQGWSNQDGRFARVVHWRTGEASRYVIPGPGRVYLKWQDKQPRVQLPARLAGPGLNQQKGKSISLSNLQLLTNPVRFGMPIGLEDEPLDLKLALPVLQSDDLFLTAEEDEFAVLELSAELQTWENRRSTLLAANEDGQLKLDFAGSRDEHIWDIENRHIIPLREALAAIQRNA